MLGRIKKPGGYILPNIFVECKENKELVTEVIQNAIKNIDDCDLSGLDFIAIRKPADRKGVFKLLDVPKSPIYQVHTRNLETGITIYENYFFRKKRTIINIILLLCLTFFYILLSFLPLLFIMIKNRNLKFWYLFTQNRIVKCLKNKNFTMSQLKLINSLIFQIGIHKYHKEKKLASFDFSLNLYEYSRKYQVKQIRKMLG